MDQLIPIQWIARSAERLSARWRTVPPAELEEVAIDLWRDETLRKFSPDAAATEWLSPVGDH